MKTMKMIFILAVFMLLTGCGKKATALVEPTDEKHTEAYIHQRIDSIYSSMKYRGPIVADYDSLFCTSRYNALKSKALELSKDGGDEVIIDYDHWTNSQDDFDFAYQIKKVEHITDSTAVVTLEAYNLGEIYPIVLGLYFERDDWYVDNFLSVGEGNEKEYLQRIIREKQ